VRLAVVFPLSVSVGDAQLDRAALVVSDALAENRLLAGAGVERPLATRPDDRDR
jgi:hypothetical protein